MRSASAHNHEREPSLEFVASQYLRCDERIWNTGTHLTLDRACNIHHDKTKYYCKAPKSLRLDLSISSK